MVVKRTMGILLAGTVLGASSLIAAPAFADDAQLQQQVNAMQQQLEAMQAQLAQTKKEANAAQQAVQSIPPGLYNAAPPGAPMATKGPAFLPAGVNVSFAGSFIEGATVWRQRNEISSGASDPPFGTLPFSNSPLYHENEWRASAQQSRIAIKMTGDIDPAQHLKAYYETDFLGAGVTANSRESNSYNLRDTPRLRRVRQRRLTTSMSLPARRGAC